MTDNKTINFVNEIYDNLTFFDMYGNSILILIFMTLFVFGVYSYFTILQTKEMIASDWAAQRCKPQNIMFAGYIAAPPGASQFEYTNENFQYCIQNILLNMTQYALEPFEFMVYAINEIFVEFTNAIQIIRDVINNIRTSLSAITETIYNKIMNVIIPMQKILITVVDIFNKLQGAMVSTLYAMLGSYYTLQSLLTAVLDLMIRLLVVLAIVIVGLWILPFTWPTATALSLVFIALVIPLAIVVYFMTEVLQIKTSALPQLRCFDKNTQIQLLNNNCKTKTIDKICPGDILHDGSKVTAKIKVTSRGLDMFKLNNIVISGCHIVKYQKQWIHVRNHPNAVAIANYSEPYLYCLNTSTKTITIDGIIFTDWDEIYDDTLEFILKYKDIKTSENISKMCDCGFNENTKIKLLNGYKLLKDIEIGDILSNNGIVYGFVELDKNNLGININLYHLLVSNQYVTIEENIYPDYNDNIDAILKLKKI